MLDSPWKMVTFLLTSGLAPPLVGCPSCIPSATRNTVPICSCANSKKSELDKMNVTVYL